MSGQFSLVISGPASDVFDVSDQLGFDGEMTALAVSVFEDGSSKSPSGRMFVQALYASEKEAETALAGLSLAAHLEPRITELPDEDWVSKSQAGLPPVSAGRFWVYGAHDAENAEAAQAEHPILIEAGLAFGTGHQGTTKGCLIIFDELLSCGVSPLRVLDLGCGAGVLAIAAAMALGRTITATDIDQDAVDVTLQNAVVNNVASVVDAYRADGFGAPELTGKRFDLIFANILAGPLMGLAPSIARAMAAGGHVILSGILDEQAETVTKAFEAEGLILTSYPSREGWTSLLGKMP